MAFNPDLLNFHHVGLACRHLIKERISHEQLGFAVEGEPFHDPLQRIHGLFMIKDGVRIELLEPSSSDSPVAAILANGLKMYHQAFTCPDLPAAISYMESLGARVIAPPAPAVAFHGKPICFLMLRTLLIVELIQN